ncbi:MAG: cyclase family protein [Flavobacteriales bacterium]|nr:cyclase family protein [Flavobacteriales bacterium]
MTAHIETGQRTVKVDLGRPLPISIRMRNGSSNPVAWYASYPEFTPVLMEGFIGSVSKGGSVNTNDIKFNPHGNGTHTECIGHLTEEAHQIDEFMRDFIFLAKLISVEPEVLLLDESEFRKKGDKIINEELLHGLDLEPDVKALIIRTLPNEDFKLTQVYTGNNPAYMDNQAMDMLKEMGVEHLLIDLPSVDRENDGGKMLAHRAFWYQGNKARMHSTITEMVYVPDSIADGDYLLNIMVAPLGNDASPSKPVLYPVIG